MIKKLLKRTLLITSVIVSGAIGFIFNSDKMENQNPSQTALQEPIFSIDTAYADGAGGDCCCSDTYGYEPAPEPTSAWVNIEFII